jgi:hypothetical protein
MHTFRSAILSGIIIVFAALLVWKYVLYNEPEDPKSLDYVLWKHHTRPNANLQYMTEAFGNDAERNKLIAGMTKEELHQRFGETKSLEEALPYYRWCIENSSLRGSDVVLLRDTELAVFFDHGQAVEVRRMKGC